MKLFDYQTEVSDMRHAIGRAKAVCSSFGRAYVDGLDKHVIALGIEADPEKYEYLFAALVDELHEAYQIAARIADAEIEQ